MMMWLYPWSASSLVRQRMQPQHQRRSLKQNESVFIVFVPFTGGLFVLLAEDVVLLAAGDEGTGGTVLALEIDEGGQGLVLP